jgi:choline dehydrogenase-like flavoprotein
VQRSKQAVGYRKLAAPGILLRYAISQRGRGVSNGAEAGGFVCSSLAKDDRPDIQLHFAPVQLKDHGRQRLPGHGYSLHACVLRPASRGKIRLRSANPQDPPRILANYLTDPDDYDRKILMEGVRISRAVFAAAAFDPYRATEVFPGTEVRSDAQLMEFVRSKAETVYHPVGTCRMGRDELAVVDAELRVHGVTGLRVADASIMPTLVSGNTNAPAIMIGEKAADMILMGPAPLPERARPRTVDVAMPTA